MAQLIKWKYLKTLAPDRYIFYIYQIYNQFLILQIISLQNFDIV